MTLFLGGDVMLGRGIDQILPHPGDPTLHEDYIESARDYVRLAGRAHGPIPRPVAFDYVWGEALDEWRRIGPDVRIVNLETAITRSDAYVPKAVNYRMNPDNIGCLLAAEIGACGLANNHVLDWGEAGLLDTLRVLGANGVSLAGAGRDLDEAGAPAVIHIPGKGRVILFAFAMPTSGTPLDWTATSTGPGVNYLADLSDTAVERIARQVRSVARAGDVVIVSIYWGPNWGWAIPAQHRRFAHALIDRAGISILHGHSSHHPIALEHHRNRLVLYGCGDFLNDYEGISGYEEFRGDLSLMYFVTVDTASGDVTRLEITPLRMRRFRLERAGRDDAAWLHDRLDRESALFDTRLILTAEGRLRLEEGEFVAQD